jgi:hypothetical protein
MRLRGRAGARCSGELFNHKYCAQYQRRSPETLTIDCGSLTKFGFREAFDAATDG